MRDYLKFIKPNFDCIDDNDFTTEKSNEGQHDASLEFDHPSPESSKLGKPIR